MSLFIYVRGALAFLMRFINKLISIHFKFISWQQTVIKVCTNKFIKTSSIAVSIMPLTHK